jgi:hypothetical protein
MVGYESLLESDSLDILRGLEPHVGVVEQPCQLDLRALGFGKGGYTPDQLIWIRRDPDPPQEVVLVEIKPEAVLREDWDLIYPKVMAGRRFACLQGWRFVILTERRLRLPPVQPSSWPQIHEEPYRLVHPQVLWGRLFRPMHV